MKEITKRKSGKTGERQVKEKGRWGREKDNRACEEIVDI